jgi:hypothetical protein
LTYSIAAIPIRPDPTVVQSAWHRLRLVDIPAALTRLSLVAPLLRILEAATAIRIPPHKAPLMMIGCGLRRTYV